jgi:hypothetical protein
MPNGEGVYLWIPFLSTSFIHKITKQDMQPLRIAVEYHIVEQCHSIGSESSDP